jgi:hypothetical protein
MKSGDEAISHPESEYGVDYSYLSASTGFLVAARQLCQLTVNKAITKAIIPANANIHQLSSVL